MQDSFYIVGGLNSGEDSNIIARLARDGRWSQDGTLKVARQGHNVMFDGDFLVVLGGSGNLGTEKCHFDTEPPLVCVSQAPQLNGYDSYPEMFLVKDSFCKK